MADKKALFTIFLRLKGIQKGYPEKFSNPKFLY
jgi:hypothetical protein